MITRKKSYIFIEKIFWWWSLVCIKPTRCVELL